MTQKPIPLRAKYDDEPPRVHFARAAHGGLNAVARGGDVQDGVKLYPDDAAVPYLLRATQTVGSTSGWGASLAQASVGDFLGSLGPLSAASSLMPRGIEIDLGRSLQVSVPGRATTPNRMPFVGEGQPIPAAMENLAGTVIAARKMGFIVVFSAELAKQSSSQGAFNILLREAAAYSLDAGYFSADAGDATTHAGLLYGVTATANSGGSMQDDLAALASAAGAGGSGEVVFITGPGRYAAMPVRCPNLKGSVLPSLAVPEDRVIAVDPMSLVHGTGGLPEITASTAAIIHMSDAAQPIVASASIADPVRSLWQTNSIALSCLVDVAFGKRRSGAVAYMDSVYGW